MAENKVSAYHLSNNPKMFEPARSNTFRFIVTNFDNLLRAGADKDTATSADYIKNAQETLEFAVVSFDPPKFTLSAIEIRRANSVMKAAGMPTFSTGNLVVTDYVGANTKGILAAWQGLAYNVKTDKIGYMTDYKKDCYILEYDVNTKLINQWLLHGCWVSDLSYDPFNVENGDKRTVTAQITYDWAELLPSDAE